MRSLNRQLTMILFVCMCCGIAQAQPPLSKRDQKRLEAFEAKIEAEKKYESLLTQAETQFVAKNYPAARAAYSEAIQYNEAKSAWLTSKVNDLDILMAKNISRKVDSLNYMKMNPIAEAITIQEVERKIQSDVTAPEASALPNVETASPAQPEEKVMEPLVVEEAPAQKAIEPKAKPESKTLSKAPEPESAKLPEDLFKEYPLGFTEEKHDFPNHKVINIVVKDGIDTIVYKRVTHSWGGEFCFKDGVSISKRIWEEEVESYRNRYQQ